MKRLDVALVEWGLAPSRSKAQALLAADEIELRLNGEWTTVSDNSFDVSRLNGDDVRIKANSQQLKYVSRGGLKIASAAKTLGLQPRGWRCLDVGQSTGGFTDFLLQAGASAVLGLEVGHSQLEASLRKDPRVTTLENFNVKDAEASAVVKDWIHDGVQLAVIDVSFISLTQVLPALGRVLPKGTFLLALVKPQFEVGPQALTEDLLSGVQSRVLQAASNCGFLTEKYFACEVKGQDGTQEFFLFGRRH